MATSQWNPCLTLDSLVADIEVEQDNMDIQKEEEERINVQTQHKIRQQMLLMHLEKLRAKDQKRKITQPQTTINFSREHGWLSPLVANLDRAHRYVKNRVKKTEQWGKLFPSASQSFESRCSDLRQDLLKLELNIDRFKNILTKQLDSTDMKMKSFIADFHLESFTQGMDDEEDEPKGSNFGDCDYESEAAIDCRDMEPVREIRDINDDSPIPVDEITVDKPSKGATNSEISKGPNKKKKNKKNTNSSSNDLNDIGGLKAQVDKIKNLIQFPIEAPQNAHPQVQDLANGILLYGPPGTGKTMVMKALTEALTPKVNFLNVYGDMLSDNPTKEVPEKGGKGVSVISYASKLDRLFKRALDCYPSVIFIDDIHLFCSSRKAQTEKEINFFRSLSTFFDDNRRSKRVVLVAATNQLDSVHPGLRRPGRLEEEIEFPVPSSKDRVEILTKVFAKVRHSIPTETLTSIGENTFSYTGADLSRVYRESLYSCLTRGSDVISEEDLKKAVRRVRPSAMKEITLEIPKVYWSDIGGMHNVKQRLMKAVVWPLKHAESFARIGYKQSKGILMFGPPGCSKTMIGKALATESQLNFIAIKGPELFDKYVGESEKAVREIFRKAKQASPSILFFDELDALASERGGGSNSSSSCSVGDRVLAQLLTEIDGIEELDGVTIVAATNRPDKIDMALRRPGRLDVIIYVPLPDKETRKEILSIRTAKMAVSPEVTANIDALSVRTEGYSGAEIVALCQEAGLAALTENIDAKEVELVHFETAFRVVKPRTTKNSIAFYEEFEQIEV